MHYGKIRITSSGGVLRSSDNQSVCERQLLRTSGLSKTNSTISEVKSGEEKLRVCLVINGFHNGGIERVLENYFSHMDRSGLDLHIISHLEPNEEIEKRFRDMGFTIHHFSFYHSRAIKPKNMKEYDEFFRNNKFDIVHNNVAINILPL